MTELSDEGRIIHTLEEYTESENGLLDSKPSMTAIDEIVPEEMNITMKQMDIASNSSSTYDAISPMEMTIEETLKFRADERRKKLKEFNYKFHNNVSRVDELEKEPAYKRLGIDLSMAQPNHTNSRISVGTDSNDDLQLRSNNSYLHDNVD
jgi:cell division protein FtsZ